MNETVLLYIYLHKPIFSPPLRRKLSKQGQKTGTATITTASPYKMSLEISLNKSGSSKRPPKTNKRKLHHLDSQGICLK